MIRNIDPNVQIPRLSRTSTNIPGLSKPGIKIFKFQDLCEPETVYFVSFKPVAPFTLSYLNANIWTTIGQLTQILNI